MDWQDLLTDAEIQFISNKTSDICNKIYGCEPVEAGIPNKDDAL
jgi:hypothetical protein